MFSYDEFTQRNIGFVSEKEQLKIKESRIFFAGVGGMGGAALLTLVRAGIGEVWIADFDTFEVSNFNRQLFANLDTVDHPKVSATVEQIKKINPEIKIRTFDEKWIQEIEMILTSVDIVVNGCDDVRSTLLLMRKGKEFKKTVIDAFASPLPNVYVIRPEDPRPEEVMGFPTRKKEFSQVTEEELKECFHLELFYVLINSSSMDYVDYKATKELFQGTRKRFSFAPMVINTGTLMAFEVIRFLLGKEGAPNYKGYFFNPWSMKIERPVSFWLRPWRKIRVMLFFKRVNDSA